MIYDFVPEQDLHGYAKPWPGGAGANQWDEEWELGYIKVADGENAPGTDNIRSKNYIPVTPESQIYLFIGVSTIFYSPIIFYDEDKQFLSSVTQQVWNTAVTVPENAAYMRFYAGSLYGTTYNNNIAVNTPATVTTYSPYKNICPITGVDVPGIGTVYEGSIDTVSRELTITHGIGDLGEPTWNIDSGNNTFYCNLFAGQKGTTSTDVANAYCTAFKLASNTSVSANTEDGTIAAASGYNRVYYAKMVGATAAEFKSALTGFKFVFELSTPVKVTLTEQQITALLGNLGIARNFNDAEIMINTWLYMAQGRDPSSLTRQVLRPISKPVIDKPISFDDVVKELPADDVISPDEEPEENITEEKEEEDNASE